MPRDPRAYLWDALRGAELLGDAARESQATARRDDF